MSKLKLALSVGFGALYPLAFAPFEYSFVAWIVIAGLVSLCRQAAPREASAYGFAFGFAAFATGTYWLYYSLHSFGQAPLWIAIPLMVLLMAFMALHFAALAYTVRRLFPQLSAWGELLVWPAAWVLCETFRAWIFTGFPWLSAGYSQLDTPLSGYAAIGGVFLMSFLAVVTAVTLSVVLSRLPRRFWLVIPLAFIWVGGVLLQGYSWTQPSGKSLNVGLVQGNIRQDQKWLPENLEPTLHKYWILSEELSGVDLIVWPEAAVPAFMDQLPNFFASLKQVFAQRDAVIVTGVLEAPEGQFRHYNSVLALTESNQVYRKRHLVPFGEFFPVPEIVRKQLRLMNLPYSDFARGKKYQPGFDIKGMNIGVTICYEIAFGDEVARALPAAEVLLTVSNDAWFGDSIAPDQHLQMARMRALETGRPLLRATNTGLTAFIDAHGAILEVAEPFVPTTISAQVAGRVGVTPFVIWRNKLAILSAILLLIGYKWLLIAKDKK